MSADTERLSGVAPVCPRADDPETHRIGDDDEPDEIGIYDCCPGPHIECWFEATAHKVARELTEADAEVCS